MVQGAVHSSGRPLCLHRATEFLVFPPEELFEVENDSRGNAQVILGLIVGVGDFRQVRQQIVELQRAD